MTHYNSQHAISRIVDGQQQQHRSGKTLRRPSPGAVRSRTTTDRARRTGLCIVGSVLEKMRNSFFYSQKFTFNFNCLAEFGSIDVPSEQWCYQKDSTKLTPSINPNRPSNHIYPTKWTKSNSKPWTNSPVYDRLVSSSSWRSHSPHSVVCTALRGSSWNMFIYLLYVMLLRVCSVPASHTQTTWAGEC